MLAELEPGDVDRVKEMLDEREIRAALHRYTRGLDRLDANLAKSAFTSDAVAAYGIFDGSAGDLIDWLMSRLGEKYSATQHVLHNIRVSVRGQEASAESYVTAIHSVESANLPSLWIVGCRYVDDLVRQADAVSWRIRRRRVLQDWYLQSDSLQPSTNMDVFTHGRRDRSDDSYEVE
jgi:disulfide oxidoreductase YuzD